MATVNFRGSREDVLRVLQNLAGIMSGRVPDTYGIASGVWLTIAFAALSDIRQAFITKARGGTDEMGIKWPPLSKEYVAYQRRFGRGEESRLKKGAGLGRAHQHAPGGKKGLLTKSQLRQWRGIYAGTLRTLSAKMPLDQAKGRAAAIAWAILKKRGAKTMLEVFGNRQVEILRDTGVLFNSLSPGKLSGRGTATSLSDPTGPGGNEQIIEVLPGELVISSNVEYFEKHQTGQGVPQRKMIPDAETPVPAIWWQRWAAAGNKALVVAAQILLERESSTG